MADWVSTRRAYDALAVAYHDRFPDLRAEQPLDRTMISAFAEYVLAGDDRHLLDAGCGTGRLVGPLRESGLDVTGVDLSPGMIAVARSVHPDVEFAVADLRRMPFAADHFAGVVAWYSLINCSPADLAQALAEIARVLRPGGYLLTGFQSGVGSRLQSDAYSKGTSVSSTCARLTRWRRRSTRPAWRWSHRPPARWNPTLQTATSTRPSSSAGRLRCLLSA